MLVADVVVWAEQTPLTFEKKEFAIHNHVAWRLVPTAEKGSLFHLEKGRVGQVSLFAGSFRAVLLQDLPHGCLDFGVDKVFEEVVADLFFDE